MSLQLSDEDRAAVEAELRARQKMKAIICVRRATNASLREAMSYIDALEQQLGIEYRQLDGFYAHVYAFGKFHRDLSSALTDYPSVYANTQDGAMVVTVLFPANGLARVTSLAHSFGIEPWNFNQHKLDPNRLDPDVIRRLLYADSDGECSGKNLELFTSEIRNFEILHAAGFDFYFWLEASN